MRIRFRTSLPAVLALLFSFASLLPMPLHAAEPVVERLGIPGPIRFGGTDYALSWSSHPSPDLYKQEYLPAGAVADRYASMVMVDLLPTPANAVQAAAGMVEQLKARKATDPVVNYDVMQKPDGKEVLLDFVMSSRDASGLIIEWNAYRYTNAHDGRGAQVVGISRRAYGDAAAREFLTHLKRARARDIATLTTMTLPVAIPSTP